MALIRHGSDELTEDTILDMVRFHLQRDRAYVAPREPEHLKVAGDGSEDPRGLSPAAPSQTSPETPSEGLYARTRGEPRRKVSQSQPLDRGRTLRARAKRLTGKRRAQSS
jgi:hypothetical protein